jgi:hypothetical protein
MEAADRVLNQEEVVLYCSSLDECTLIVIDQLWEGGSESNGHCFSYDLGNTVNQTHRPVIPNVNGIFLLWQQSDVRLIEAREAPAVR